MKLSSQFLFMLTDRNCTWHEWMDWGQCSATCDTGIMERNRIKAREEVAAGICPGKTTETKPCKLRDCGKSMF